MAKVDVLLLDCSGGNMFDIVALAVRVRRNKRGALDAAVNLGGSCHRYPRGRGSLQAALLRTKIPAIVVSGDGANEPFDFEVLPDQSKAPALPATGFPVLLTFAQIDGHVIVDATPREEACAAGFIHVAVTPAGGVAALHKSGVGGTHPSLLLDLLARAQVI